MDTTRIHHVVMAAAAHPDDIEFMMSGTLVKLKKRGWEVHYLNIANGSCGSATLAPVEIARIRTEESRRACALLGAEHHEPLVDDLMVYTTPELVAKLAAIVRQVRPSVLLLQSPQDYMEDHVHSQRAMATAAFCRGMRNFHTIPDVAPVDGEMAVYHAMPYGLRDHLRQFVAPEFFVDTTAEIETKAQALACHQSQKEWLDVSQGLDSYLQTMREMDAEVGGMSGTFRFAEGWRRRLHLGYGSLAFDPVGRELAGEIVYNKDYFRGGRPDAPDGGEDIRQP